MKLTRKSLLIILILLVISIFTFIIIIRVLVEYLVTERQKLNLGIIDLPNEYSVVKINSQTRIISDPEKTTVVKVNIKEIGWDDIYILYKRLYDSKSEIGYINTQTGEKVIVKENTDAFLEDFYKKYNIRLGIVEKFFLETKKLEYN